MIKLVATALVLSIFAGSFAQTKPRLSSRTQSLAGYWPLEKSQPIIDKTQTIRLAPELAHLSDGERKAVKKLLEVGKIFQRLYELQRHPEAISSEQKLIELDRRAGSPATENLTTLYRLFQGPIATTLENKREAFLPVPEVEPGKNVYPWGVNKQEIEKYLAANPEKRDELLYLRSVVKRATTENLRRDLSAIRKYPVLDTLHPGLRESLTPHLAGIVNLHHGVTEITEVSGQTQKSPGQRPTTKSPRVGTDSSSFYAVPYSVAYADELMKAYALLNEAADAVAKDDEEFAGYLRNRARDLLSDHYESGDAAWVTGHFKNLNAQIGSYEVYDDELYGVKSFFGLSLLASRQKETTALRQAMKGLQALEESLPYENHKKIREDIPVGVYDVIADFGQTRGGNTATILPNESYLARRYGRTILLRANIMREPNIFAGTSRNWEAAVAPEHKDDLTPDGNFYRTLWHEVGHYLGVDRTRDGKELDEALQENSSAMEEMKADLASLFVVPALAKNNYYTDAQKRAVYASGILRVLQNNRPRRDQPYNTMQLMQWNFFLENGLLTFENGRLRIHYDKYHDVAGKLLQKVLDVQYQGDKAASDRFIEEYTRWDDNLHGVIAKNIRDQQRYRFRLFRYAALGE